MKLSSIIESSLQTDLNQHKNRPRQVSCCKTWILITSSWMQFPQWGVLSGSKQISQTLACDPAQRLSVVLLCLLILCQTLFVRFEVFWKGIKPYVRVVCKVGGFIDGRHTPGFLSRSFVFVSRLTMIFMPLSYTNQEQWHVKPNKRLVGCMNYLHSR